MKVMKHKFKQILNPFKKYPIIAFYFDNGEIITIAYDYENPRQTPDLFKRDIKNNIISDEKAFLMNDYFAKEVTKYFV